MAVCRPIRRPTIRPTRYRSFLLRKLGSAVSRCFRLLLARAAREATSRDRTLSRCVHITSLVVRGSSASPGTSTNLLTGRVRSRVRSVSHVRKTFDFKDGRGTKIRRKGVIHVAPSICLEFFSLDSLSIIRVNCKQLPIPNEGGMR